MPKCDVVGCQKEAVLFSSVPLFDGLFYAKVSVCSQQHYNEVLESLKEAQEEPLK